MPQAVKKSRQKSPKGAVYFVRAVLESQPGFEWTRGAVENSQDAAQALDFIRSADREHLALLCLSTKNVPLAYTLAAIGTGNAAQARPGEILRVPLLAGASALILAHNHPSGDLTPSEADRRLTGRVAEAARRLGLRLLDHLILGPGRTPPYSFADYGQMP